jgi:hypothetical protein
MYLDRPSQISTKLYSKKLTISKNFVVLDFRSVSVGFCDFERVFCKTQFLKFSPSPFFMTEKEKSKKNLRKLT